MALLQEITNEKGATINYHRIASAILDFDKMEAKLTVYSYVSQAVRDQEKQDAKAKADYDINYQKLLDQLNQLVDEPTKDNKDRRIELTNQINQMAPVPEPTPRHLCEFEYTIDLVEHELVLADAYDWLKTEAYQGAIDTNPL